MFVAETIALIMAIIYLRKTKVGRGFIYYIGFDYLVLLLGMAQLLYKDLDLTFQHLFVRITNPLIATIELLTYYFFFSKLLLSKKVKELMKILSIIFVLIVVAYNITRAPFLKGVDKYIADAIGSLEFIFLLPPAVQYYFQLLNTTSEINLFDRPSFWIVTGIFLYSLISIPYYLLQTYLVSNFTQFSFALEAAFYFMPFTLNFIFLIRGILCKKPLTI